MSDLYFMSNIKFMNIFKVLLPITTKKFELFSKKMKSPN